MNGAILVIPLALAAAGIAAPPPQAGQWLHRTTLVDADIPGVLDAVVRAAPAPKPRISCLTPVQSARQPETLFFAPDAVCTSRKYSLTNGRIRGNSTCRVDRLDTPVKTTTTGTYTATGYTTRSVTVGTRYGRPLKIVSSTSGRWIGAACK